MNVHRHYAMVKRRAAEFRQGRNSLEDEPWLGCPSEAVCEENCRATENTVLQNHGVNVQLIADAVGISCLLYTSPSPRDGLLSRMPSSA